jgi:nucleotide-binding universal stress UspA family protein
VKVLEPTREQGVKRILVCLDTSPRVPQVVEHALAIAKGSGAKLVLIRVIGLPHDARVPPEALSMSPRELIELWRRNAERDLEGLRATLPADSVDSVVVQVGSPWDAICSTARELGTELIVLGSHGYEPIDRVLGTTAANVVNHAEQSVLVVR